MLYVLTGVRGAGKTTLIENIKNAGVAVVLQPSTTRLPRFDGETEYDFVSQWQDERYAWSIKVGEQTYGMRNSEIERAAHLPAFTVFEPIAIDTFYDYRRRSNIVSRTIGLDTVSDLAEQHLRVGGSASRMMSIEQFDQALQKVREADVVITGNEHDVLHKMKLLVESIK